jgi:hypothetical protein
VVYGEGFEIGGGVPIRSAAPKGFCSIFLKVFSPLFDSLELWRLACGGNSTRLQVKQDGWCARKGDDTEGCLTPQICLTSGEFSAGVVVLR